jgi:hypothetical protein
MLKFHSEDEFDESILQGYDTASMGNHILAFRGNVAGSASSFEMSKEFGSPQKLQNSQNLSCYQNNYFSTSTNKSSRL